jgi:hypothetical protein
MARACAVMRIEGKKSEAPYLGLSALREEAKDKQNPWSAFLSCPAYMAKRADASTRVGAGQCVDKFALVFRGAPLILSAGIYSSSGLRLTWLSFCT